jgi:hypothetical protein
MLSSLLVALVTFLLSNTLYSEIYSNVLLILRMLISGFLLSIAFSLLYNTVSSVCDTINGLKVSLFTICIIQRMTLESGNKPNKHQEPLKYGTLLRNTFNTTYIVLFGYTCITLIEALRTNSANTRHIMNIETAVSLVAGIVYGTFVEKIKQHYVEEYGAESQQVKDASDGYHFEPHVAEKVFRSILKAEKNIKLYEEFQFDSDPLNVVSEFGLPSQIRIVKVCKTI